MKYGWKCFLGHGVTNVKEVGLMCKIRIIVSYFVLLLLLALAVASYSYAAESLTLEQAIAAALANNAGLKAADSQIESADAGVLRSASGFLPRVAASETWSKSDNPLMVFGTKLNQEIVSLTDFNPAVINHPEAISNYNTKFSIIQPIWNGGKEYIGREQAHLAKDASVQDRERTRQETVFGVVKAYYGLLLAREYHRVAQQSFETSKATLRLAEARFNAGAVLQSDLLRAKVQLAEIREMLTRSESGIKLAAANLNFAMGVPEGAEYDVSGDLSIQESNPDLNSLIDEAARRRPDLLSLSMNSQNAEKSVAMAKADYLPTLNFMGEVDWNSDKVAGDDAKSWAVMAVFQWNLFDGMVTRSKVKEAVATRSRMKFLEERMRSAVQLQVRQAYYDLTASTDRIAASSSSVQEAEEGLKIVQKRYETGMTTFVDVLGAENALIKARTNALQALYDNNIAFAELKLAVGTL